MNSQFLEEYVEVKSPKLKNVYFIESEHFNDQNLTDICGNILTTINILYKII